MESIQSGKNSQRNKRLRKYLWVLFAILFIISLILLLFEIGPVILGIVVFFISVADLVIIYVTTEKYYNWPITFVLLFLMGFFFKRQHWPMAGVLLTIGICFLCITSLVNAIRFQFTERKNPFLRWFGSVSCIIISTYMFGMLFRFQHWPKDIADFFGYTGIVLFVISILGMVFTLPGSNYIGWSENEKKIFFRAILIPMGIVFSLIIITLVFSDVFLWILDRNAPFWEFRDHVELFNLEGIRSL